MIIDNEKKFIFICVAKTGSTSIRRMLGFPGDKDPLPHIYHMSYKDVLKDNPQVKDYFKFAFVRNPYTRLYSAYCNFKYDGGHDWATLIKQRLSFEDFILNLKESGFGNYIHLKLQSEYLINDKEINFDFIGRFENFKTDCQLVFEKLNIPFTNVHERISSKNEPYHYTNEMKDIVYNLYKDDFNNFSYEP